MSETLTKAQLAELRQKLLDERARIIEVLRGSAAPGAERVAELEEAAQRETEATHASDVADRESTLLAEVEQALARMERGRYGVSEDTGQPIRLARLRAVPWARRDVDE